MTNVLNYLFRCLKQYKYLMVMLLSVGLIWAILETLLPYLLKLIIDHAVKYKSEHHLDFKIMEPYLGSYLLTWLIFCINLRLHDLIEYKLYPILRKDIMSNNFSTLIEHSFEYFQTNMTGGLVNKIMDLQNAVIEILKILNEFYCQIIGIIIASISMYIIHPLFALILLSWGMVFTLISIKFLKPLQHASYIFAHSRSGLVGKMVDSIANVMNIRLFARNDREKNWMDKNIDKTVKNDKDLAIKVIQMRLLWDVCILILISMDIVVLSYLFQQNRVSIGDFSFITSLSISILWNFWFLSGKFIDLSDKMGKAKQALMILQSKQDVTDLPEATTLQINQGAISFRKVDFAYKGRNKLFKNFNLEIPAGQKIGLVGFSGSGKSSFVNLILRLYDVQKGGIYIDGQNIRHVTQQSLRQNIALIPQEVNLFHRSILENICYARPNASIEEVIEACKKAHCHEFVKKQPKGYYTLAGERGVKLSGGQKQRIAIARAILKNAPILILDEATSALDSITERYIQQTLHQIMQQKTCIIIAHRLSTLAEMDRILVFDHGEIVEDGSHQQLLLQNGHYAKLWSLQSGGFIPE